MLRIRPSQLAALHAARRKSATSGELAVALRDLGWFDAGNEDHRQQIGAAPGTDASELAALLERFVASARASAASHGIRHELLVLHYADFFFRYGNDWASRDDVAAILGDETRSESDKMRALNRILRHASFHSGGS